MYDNNVCRNPDSGNGSVFHPLYLSASYSAYVCLINVIFFLPFPLMDVLNPDRYRWSWVPAKSRSGGSRVEAIRKSRRIFLALLADDSVCFMCSLYQ